jgi:predicted transcriptional regulator
MTSTWDETVALIQSLPDDVTYDDILREIAFARMVARGIEDAQQGRVMTTEELEQRISTWRTSS